MPADYVSFSTKCFSSLVKVFADEAPTAAELRGGSALANEVYSFQVAYSSDQLIKGIRVSVESPLEPWIRLRTVGLVPCELPWRDEHDSNVLRTTPGLYPDPLYPAELPADDRTVGERTAAALCGAHLPEPAGATAGVVAFPGQWRSVWVTVDFAAGSPTTTGRSAAGDRSHASRPEAGVHPVSINFDSQDGERLASASVELEVIDAALPPQRLSCTEWFHTDCLATAYGVEVWSEEHWRRIEQYMDSAVRHGVTMILTPVFTPPLDTAVGGERPTVQLVDVTVDSGGRYEFGFDRLKRWVEAANRAGLRSFEFSHLFTQWGAQHCPKIVATVDGRERRIFGWDTLATGDEYKAFLDAFLPALVRFLQERGLTDRVAFHVSDEPRLEHLDQYRAARELVEGHLCGFPIMDALSNYEFFERGVVDLPIPASNHIEPFIDGGVKPLWTYYCVGQKVDVANRFFAMPSARNRVLGAQLYAFDVDGFLQWGLNFWYSQFSIRPVNPFLNTDAGYAFPSGDAFLVYPGVDGPIDSIRYEVFREALQDLRALRLLESLVGRAKTTAILEDVTVPGADPDLQPITFSRYPQSDEWLLSVRERVNQAIKDAARP